MEYNFGKKIAALTLTISLVAPAFYLPIFAPRAQAIFGFGDLVIDVKALADRIADAAAMSFAQRLIDDTVRSTVEWAQSGFDGNPAYATDPGQYFTNIADGVAGEFIAGSNFDYLCSPFQTQVRLAIQRQYTQQRQFQCTLTDVVANIDAFYNDFNQGGWDAWFTMTQHSANNPYGAFLTAQAELDSRIARQVGLKKDELDRNSGFLSWATCEKRNPAPFLGPGDPGWDPNYGAEYQPNPEYIEGFAEGECLKRGPVQTPGATIKSQLDQVLPSGLNKLITAQHWDQLVSAFATGLLNRYVFSDQGLFNRTPNNAGDTRPTPTNIDTCEAAREFYGDAINCSQAVPQNSSGNTESEGNGEVCATQEEIAAFLENNPGDAGRLSEAFPCI